ncbi:MULTISPECIES: arylformamidase [unclassified Virgibacillus]|uniref:arylformamidase n=1 Tax=unclassified Virgibacillus TaxID=2620237 RepID=UPI0024DE7F24|nr:arylformamidase [Virgibacillus sp. LDC-1]
MNKNKWIDISQPLTNNIAVWPGDTPFTYALSCTKEQSGSVNVGSISTSVHTGTHVDAPFHFNNHGDKIHELDINRFIGKARVIDVRDWDVIGQEELESFDLAGVSRLLLRMKERESFNVFPEAYPILHENMGPFLKEKHIHLIGIEAPSVDPVDSKELTAHHALSKHGVSILENLVLTHVAPGDYELIALPLAIYGGDGSPVRAVIRPLEEE